MSTLFDEKEADREVIRVLIKELNKRRYMSLLQLKDGTVIRVDAGDYLVVSPEELQQEADRAAAALAEIQDLLPSSPTIQSPSPENELPQAEVPVAPVVEPVPAAEPLPQPVAPTFAQPPAPIIQ